jgi:tetratricopeptide (TPR) repeat protein
VVLSSLFLLLLLGGGLWYQARLRAAVDEAHKEQNRADANYRKARGAVQRMLARLGERRLADVPRLQELRRDQLEDALAFYQGILGDLDNPNPDVRFDVAVAYQETATIQGSLGRPKAARENFRQAITMLEDLCAAHPDVLDYAAQQAGCYTALGGLHIVQNRPEEARDPYDKALAIWERLTQARPDDRAWKNALAVAHHNLGHLSQGHSPREAERHYDRAVAIRTALVRSHSEVAAYRGRLAEDYLNLGLLYQQTGRPGDAGATFHKAEALLGPLGREHPDQYALSLAGVYINWGNLHKETGQLQAGLDLLNRAVRLAEERLRQEPQLLEARKRALEAHGARAQVYEALKRYADAIPDWDRVVELGPGPDQAGYRSARAAARVRIGEYAPAVAEAKELVEKERVSRGTLYNVACIYALAVTAASSDTTVPASERARLAEQYAAQTVALLQQLRASGYFKDAAHAELLGKGKDADLQSLHNRNDFKKLLEQVGKDPGR